MFCFRLPHLVAAALSLAIMASASASAAAADTLVAPDPEAGQVAALDGTVVWVSGAFPSQTLFRHSAATGTTPVKNAVAGRVYRSIDLGHDASGQLVLTYVRCRGTGECRVFRDDLNGRATTINGLVPKRCELSGVPAIWGNRVAYGLGCYRVSKGQRVADGRRSGFYVRNGSKSPRRLALPKDAIKFGADEIARVDLRATRAAAVAADIYEYVFSQSVGGRGISSFLAVTSEGESTGHVRGLALGAGGVTWSLAQAEHSDDPKQSIIGRMLGDCLQIERLASAGPGADFRAGGLAVDGDKVFLSVPGTGIVRHDFVPERAC